MTMKCRVLKYMKKMQSSKMYGGKSWNTDWYHVERIIHCMAQENESNEV